MRGAIDNLREAMRGLPTLAIASPGAPPTLSEIYFPEGHADVLDPEVSLVVGNRGMGKTFWSLVLADDRLREEVTRRYLGRRTLRLDNLQVSIGFGGTEGPGNSVTRLELQAIGDEFPPEIIWRAVLLGALAPVAGRDVPTDLAELVRWISRNPSEQVGIFRAADQSLARGGFRRMFVFDALDQLADDWTRIQNLTQGIIKLALAMKSYRNIKVKIFMRPDQAENKSLFRFPDGSKILSGSRVLSWRATDLYGLFFFEMLRSTQSVRAFHHFCQRAGVSVDAVHDNLNIPRQLAYDADKQGAFFDLLTGPFMGSSAKRGRPYTWIPTHLADARKEISPRTFLRVIRAAADESTSLNQDTVIDYLGIQEGVRSASSARLAELEEDYPWVSMALAPLRGLLVPCLPREIAARWEQAGTLGTIIGRYRGAQAPIDLVFANLDDLDVTELLSGTLQEIGVLEKRSNGKVDVPDIFRVNAGILRKGGITPQQRKSLL